MITKKTTVREILQLTGTNLFREQLHPNIWVNSLMSEYKILHYFETGNNAKECRESRKAIYPNWIITDLRFPNEMETIKKKGGITIRVNRYCYDSLEDYLVSYPEVSVSKKASQVVQDWGLNGKGMLEEELKKIPESVGFFNRSFHESETALDSATFDYVIDNNSSIESLVEKVKTILKKEKII